MTEKSMKYSVHSRMACICTECGGFADTDIMIKHYATCSHAERNVTASELQDILDLLRTGTAPMSWGMTDEQWLFHKCNKAAGQLAAVIERMRS